MLPIKFPRLPFGSEKDDDDDDEEQPDEEDRENARLIGEIYNDPDLEDIVKLGNTPGGIFGTDVPDTPEPPLIMG